MSVILLMPQCVKKCYLHNQVMDTADDVSISIHTTFYFYSSNTLLKKNFNNCGMSCNTVGFILRILHFIFIIQSVADKKIPR